MFFTFSKILYFLLVPYHWVLLLLLAMWFLRKTVWKKRLGWATLIVTLLASNQWLYQTVAWHWQPKVAPQVHQRNYRMGILLGGMSYADDSLQRYFGSTASRFIQAAKLYHTGTVQYILLSGGDGSLKQDHPGEAPFLRQELLALHVPDSAILVEDKSRNTYESALAAKPYLTAKQVRDTSILITSAMHMPRALGSFTKAGIAVKPHVADYILIRKDAGWSTLVVPDLSLLSHWQYLLKEMVGLQVYRWTGKSS